MKFQHFIITRCNIFWQKEALSEEWNKKRMELLNKNLRKSLVEQTNQNFKFISLWGKFYNGGELKNEHKELIQLNSLLENRTMEEKEAWSKNFQLQLKSIIKRHSTGTPMLITRIDSDDRVEPEFVGKLQKAVNFDKFPYYYDVDHILIFDKTGIIGEKTEHKQSRNTSCFVSVLSKQTECSPYKYAHPDVGKHMKGEIVPSLTAYCCYHSLNISSKFAKRKNSQLSG
jgi:hypothetical protein